MTYTSDQQLQFLGLRPLADLPKRDGVKLVLRTRYDQDINAVTPVPDYPDVIGWRPA